MPVLLVERGGEGTPDLQHHPRFPEDGDRMRELLDRVNGVLDLAEPFARVRGAIAETRKLGVAHRG